MNKNLRMLGPLDFLFFSKCEHCANKIKFLISPYNLPNTGQFSQCR